MKIGVTGSRHDRPQHTIARLRIILSDKGATELHHGDCIGFDAQAHDVAKSMGIKTVAHPPDNDAARAFKDADEVRAPKSYLGRNKAIVSEVDYVVAAPDGPEKIRSGTWSTVRFAKKSGVNGVVLSWSEQNENET